MHDRLKKHPAITVLMSVYNGEKFVGMAVESILNQSYQDFEFIIIDDGSTDNTPGILADYKNKDNRIKILRHKNKGLTCSLNTGAFLSRGEFIARQDADDMSMPDRLEKQIAFLKAHPGFAVIGAYALCTDEQGKVVTTSENNKYGTVIKVDVSRQNPISHSSAMFRKDVFNFCNGYDESFRVAQDFDLWNRMAKWGDIGLMPMILVKRRMINQGVSQKKIKEQMIAAAKIRWKYRSGGTIKTMGYILFYGLRHLLFSFYVRIFR
jgi:glycosyltransferase involved in cell wall biosynthesis